MKKKCILFLLIGWLLLIFSFSNEPAQKTTKTTNHFSEIVLSGVNICIGNLLTKEDIQKITKYFFPLTRKCAHVFLYFILAILVFLFLQDIYERKRRGIFTFLFCTFYACTDEVHQLFIRGRSGEIMDVCIDTIGIFLGIILCILLENKKDIHI